MTRKPTLGYTSEVGSEANRLPDAADAILQDRQTPTHDKDGNLVPPRPGLKPDPGDAALQREANLGGYYSMQAHGRW